MAINQVHAATDKTTLVEAEVYRWYNLFFRGRAVCLPGRKAPSNPCTTRWRMTFVWYSPMDRS